MKKTYREHFEQIKLKKDYKEDILKSVLEYENVKPKRFALKTEIIAIIAILLIFTAPALFQKNDSYNFMGKHNFIIKANDNVYNIQKSTIKFNDFEPLVSNHIMGINPPNSMMTNPLGAPLSVFIEGEKIKSIDFTITGGEFYKINEGNISDSLLNESEIECHGCFIMPKGDNTILGDSEKKDWWHSEKSNGRKITIDYEKQGTIDGLYGISFLIQDEKLVEEFLAFSEHYEENRIEIYKTIEKVINSALLNIRVNYEDGTYETTELNFKGSESKIN